MDYDFRILHVYLKQPSGPNVLLPCLHWFEKRNGTSPNQSIGRQQEVVIVLHFFCLFLPGIFLLLTGGAASTLAVERRATFFQQRFLHPSFVQTLCMFEGLSSPWTLFVLKSTSNQHRHGEAQKPAGLSGTKRLSSDLLHLITITLHTSGRSHLFSFLYIMWSRYVGSSRQLLACGLCYWLFIITCVMWFLSEGKYNERCPCFQEDHFSGNLTEVVWLNKRSPLVKIH